MESIILATLADAPFETLSIELPLFVVYDHPRDFPDKYVVRLWDTARPTPYCSLWETLETARADIPEGCVNLGRAPRDDSAILETWI